MKRRDFLNFVAGVATAWPLAAQAQAGPKKLQVAFLYPGPKAAATPRIRAVITGLQSSGLRLQDQVTIVPGLTDGNSELLASMAAELVARPVDVILASGTSGYIRTSYRCARSRERSGRQWLHRQPGPPGWQYYGVVFGFP